MITNLTLNLIESSVDYVVTHSHCNTSTTNDSGSIAVGFAVHLPTPHGAQRMFVHNFAAVASVSGRPVLLPTQLLYFLLAPFELSSSSCPLTCMSAATSPYGQHVPIATS